MNAFKCRWCQETFSSLEELRDHVDGFCTKAPISMLCTGVDPIRCDDPECPVHGRKAEAERSAL